MVNKERQQRIPTNLEIARKVLEPIWKEAFNNGTCGRTWGSQTNPENPYRASNITMAVGNELVIINEDKKGNLKIHGFKRDQTNLEKRIVNSLRENKLIE